MNNAVLTERQGKNELTLYKLDTPRRSWTKGPLCHYELSYKWHRNSDENSVLGAEVILLTEEEVLPVIESGSLFDWFNLFS